MKVILTIAAGRRLTMSGLIPQLLAEEGWDEMHVWVNTKDHEDLVFLSKLPQLDNRIQLKLLDTKTYTSSTETNIFVSRQAGNIGDWWPQHCTDPNAIYVRFDDDVVFVEKGTVKALVEARLANPDPYLIFPVIINNGLMAYYLEQHGKLKHPEDKNYTPFVWDPLVFSADLCFDIHEQFINQVKKHGMDYFHVPNTLLDPQHISINCMAYFGKDIAEWGGKFDTNGEEGFITCVVPYRKQRPLMIMGNKVVSHFAFHTQRNHWDGPTDDEDVKMYVGQKVQVGSVIPELQEKFEKDLDFQEKVKKRANTWNKHLEVLEAYRDLFLNLYDVHAFPIQHQTWNWLEIKQHVYLFKQNRRRGQQTISTTGML